MHKLKESQSVTAKEEINSSLGFKRASNHHKLSSDFITEQVFSRLVRALLAFREGFQSRGSMILSTVKKLKARCANQMGFTLMELILSIVIGSSIFGIAAETLMSQTGTYSFIANRKQVIADMRFGMNKMSQELTQLQDGELLNIAPSSIGFTNTQGNETSFSLQQAGESQAIYYGNDVLIPNVSSFQVEYQDGDGNVLIAGEDTLEDVRRIKITVTSEATENDNGITLSTTVVPRSFIGYSNYQQ